MSNERERPFTGATDEIDVKEILLYLWGKRWLLLGSTLVGLSFSAVYAYKIAKPVFESSALLLPTQSNSSSSDQLGAAAALLGKKTESGSADVDLYKSLLTSRTVIRKLLLVEIQDMSDSGKGRESPLFKLMKVDTSNPLEMENAIAVLSKSVAVGSKESGAGGILGVRFSANNPWLAQQACQNLLAIGQEELREVRVDRAEAILPRLSKVANLAKAEWDSAARRTTWFKDRNRSITLPEQMLELSRLQMEQQVREQKYMLARKEYESQVLEREKAAPPMMIFDPANLPAKKSKPRRIVLLIMGIVVGFGLGSLGILVWGASGLSAKE